MQFYLILKWGDFKYSRIKLWDLYCIMSRILLLRKWLKYWIGLITIAIDCNGHSFSKKNGPILPLDQNPHQTVTRFGYVGFSMYVCGFSVPQMRQFCLFTYPPRSKWTSSENMIFFAKISTFWKPIAESENKLDGQLASTPEWRHTKFFMQNSWQRCLRNV